MRLTRGLLLGASVAVLAVVGCMGSGVQYPKVVDVTGSVLLDGEPLAGATITFVPSNGRASSGQTDANGRYMLAYTKTIAGAIFGWHRVMIRKEVIDQAFLPSQEEMFADTAQDEFLEATGVPLHVGEAAAGRSSEQHLPMPLKPPLLSVVAERYNGPKSVLFAVVDAERYVFDFAVTSE